MKTPRQHTAELRERLNAVLLRLPAYFASTFIHAFPEYKGQEKHVYNVTQGRSLDENVIERFEQLADKITPTAKTA